VDTVVLDGGSPEPFINEFTYTCGGGKELSSAPMFVMSRNVCNVTKACSRKMCHPC
jgi:hypothetical protein